MSAPADLVLPVLDRLVAALGAVETPGADGGPFLSLTTLDDGSPAGRVRVFAAPQVPRIVYSSIDVPGMETHLVYAFAPADSAVPHLTLDAVATRGIHAFHVDLVPRVDLATHRAYLVDAFAPLDAPHRQVDADPTYVPAAVPPQGRALMSPWMLACRTDEAGLAACAPTVDAYVVHWLGLVADGLGAEAAAEVSGEDLAARDAALRQNLFGLDVDPAWDHVAGVVGAAPVSTLRAQLLGRD
jgi:hypothetical protein